MSVSASLLLPTPGMKCTALLLQALCKCSTLPAQLLDQILHPTPSASAPSRPLAACGLPPQLTAALQRQYNASQQAAVAAAVTTDKQAGQFTLVQVLAHACVPISGPPAVRS